MRAIRGGEGDRGKRWPMGTSLAGGAAEPTANGSGSDTQRTCVVPRSPSRGVTYAPGGVLPECKGRGGRSQTAGLTARGSAPNLRGLSEFLQQLLNGISLGAIYALIALGYTMVYGVLRFINFAHADLFMVGAFLGYFGGFATMGMILSLPLCAVGIWLLLKIIPAQVLDECRNQADEWFSQDKQKPRSWVGLTLILSLWGLAAWLTYSTVTDWGG